MEKFIIEDDETTSGESLEIEFVGRQCFITFGSCNILERLVNFASDF
jgi:hypothetical protein